MNVDALTHSTGNKQAPRKRPLWAYVLWPLGIGFLWMARIRVRCSRLLSRPIRLGRPTISVGNLTFGGTGKTPFSIYLAERVRTMGAEPAVILRGYGRETRGPIRVSPDHSAREVGEEALVLARSLSGLAVVVAERREEGAALLDDRVDVIILDDAFQHLRVHRDLDLLLIDASRPQDLHAPPVGRLRESISAVSRAHFLVTTRGEPRDLTRKLLSRSQGLQTISARFEWSEEALSPSGHLSWGLVGSSPVVAFAGIGNPAAFFAQAEEMGLDLASRHVWPDHAIPSVERLHAIAEDVRRTGAGAVLTTMKDAVKWERNWTLDVPLVYPNLSVRLEDPDGHLDASLRSLLERRP
jgi:tetraacyldisaccharide 4'-kinase